MNDISELMKDCAECANRIRNFEQYDYEDTCNWALERNYKWLSRNNGKYLPTTTVGFIAPNSVKEKAWNAVNNYRDTLIKISIMLGVDTSINGMFE